MAQIIPFGIRMEAYLTSLGFDVWKFVVDDYTAPTTPPIDMTDKKACEYNAKANNVILSGLKNSKFIKVMHCKSAKDI